MKNLLSILFVASLAFTASCARNSSETDRHADHDADEVVKGTHNGRLLSDGDFQIEVAIFERGVPPEFHVYAYEAGKPLDPQAVKLDIELTRFGNRKDVFNFTPREDYLRGSAVVEEPHSFDVRVIATHRGQRHEWSYESYEGRTGIAAETARASGIETALAGPGVLRDTVMLYGSIQANPERVRQVSARYPGLIRSVSGNVGERVGAGTALAVIESNESLQNYTLTAPIAGVITQRSANAGEATGAAPLFVISDFGSVLVELSVFPRDRTRLAPGQAVRVAATDGAAGSEGRLGAIVTKPENQSLVARIALDNRDSRWTPGQFVTAEIAVAEHTVPIAIPVSALQKFRDWDVVFLNLDDGYQAMPVELGRNDGKTAEVLSGLEPGQRYVVANSYLVKADIEKSGASHDH